MIHTIQAPELTSFLIEYLKLRGEVSLDLLPGIRPVVVMGDISPGGKTFISGVEQGVTLPVGGELAVRNPGTGEGQVRLTVAQEDQSGYGLIPPPARAVSYPSLYNTYFAGRGNVASNYFVGTLAVTDAYVVRIRQIRFVYVSGTGALTFNIHINAGINYTNASERVPTLLDSRGNEVDTVGLTSQTGYTSSNSGVGIIDVVQVESQGAPQIWTPAVPIILREDDSLAIRSSAVVSTSGAHIFVDYELWNTQGEREPAKS